MTTPTVALYDVSRLVKRRHRDSPTGIDRIDLAFALAAFDRLGPRCLPVICDQARPRLVDRAAMDTFLARLAARWLGENGAGDPAAMIEATGFASIPVFRHDHPPFPAPAPFARVARAARVCARPIAEGAHRLAGREGIARMGGPRSEDFVYVNVGHDGLLRALGAGPWPPLPLPRRSLVYVHDILPITHPALSTAASAETFRRFLSAVVGSGADVLVNSGATADALATHVGSPRPRVLYPGVEPPPGVLRSEAGGEAAFAVVGTIEPRKNHRLLVEVWRRLAAEGPPPRLDVVGRAGWEAGETAAFLASEEARALSIRTHGSVSDRRLAEILSTTRALLMPSLAEGFGLPFAEAAAAGIPIIASDLPAFREIAPDGVTFLGPRDVAGWTAAVRGACETPLPRPALAPGIGGWETQGAAFADVLEEALG